MPSFRYLRSFLTSLRSPVCGWGRVPREGCSALRRECCLQRAPYLNPTEPNHQPPPTMAGRGLNHLVGDIRRALGRKDGIKGFHLGKDVGGVTSGGMFGARCGEKAVSRDRISDSRYGSRSS